MKRINYFMNQPSSGKKYKVKKQSNLISIILILATAISAVLIILISYNKNTDLSKTEPGDIGIIMPEDSANAIGIKEEFESVPPTQTEDINTDTPEIKTPKPKNPNGTIPGTPLVPVLTASDNSICINWLKVRDAKYYEIFCSQDGSEYKFLDEISSIAYLAQDLTSDSEYYFKIRAVSEDDREGEFSPPCSAKTEAPYELPSGYAKTELMIVPTHMDDELIFFGGILPYYSKYLNRKTALVFTCDNGDKRKKQERESLNVMGLTELEPEFLGFLGNFRLVEKETWQKKTDDGLILEMVRAIRKNRPNVIVTHDTNGEYGHSQHILTTFILTRALQKCANPNYDEKSVENFGTWMPKKVYIHLYPKNEIKLDYSQPLKCYNEQNAFDMAHQALQKHPNALKSYRVYYTGDQYDSSKFGLYYSSVGPDKNADLFDNL